MSIQVTRAIPPHELSGGLATVPDSAADLTTVTTIITQIVACNKSAVDATLTITDKQSPAKTIACPLIAAGFPFVVAFPDGVKMIGGVNWVASAASSIDAEVFGWKQETH
jgi:hypothetical protein